jgi:hypothetical protein
MILSFVIVIFLSPTTILIILIHIPLFWQLFRDILLFDHIASLLDVFEARAGDTGLALQLLIVICRPSA